MMGDMHRILLVEDSRDDADLFGFALDDAGLEYVLRVVGNERELREALASFVPSVVVSDLSLPGYSGLAALALAHATLPRVPLVLLTGFDDLESPPLPVHLLRKSELSRVPVLIAGLPAA
jgi:DNA-binding NtrC family response regulator